MRLLGLLPSLVAHITKGKNAVYLRQINNNVEEYIVQFPVRLVWMLVKKMRGRLCGNFDIAFRVADHTIHHRSATECGGVQYCS